MATKASQSCGWTQKYNKQQRTKERTTMRTRAKLLSYTFHNLSSKPQLNIPADCEMYRKVG